MTRLAGKTALVTGAASGIGEATIARFLAEGARVVATDLREITASSERMLALRHDVTVEADWARVITETEGTFGGLDILVNNAGITSEKARPIMDLPLEEWRSILAVNLDGPFLGTKFAMRAMEAKGGVIVNVASIHSFVAAAGISAYGSSKSGLAMLTKIAAIEGARNAPPIRVNSVHPGYVLTPLLEARFAQNPEREGGILDATPLRRLGTPDEVAAAILYIASEDAAYMTGAGLTLDGGYTAI